MADRKCSILDCGVIGQTRRGWCKNHYARWQRWGDPLGGSLSHLRFPENMLKRLLPQPNGCVYLDMKPHHTGYHLIAGPDGVKGPAHRWSYEYFVGPIPDGLVVDHECHNQDPTCTTGMVCLHRRCINPPHLRPKTQGENTKASDLTIPAAHEAKTHCVNGHEFTPENTRITPQGWRVCRDCKRDAYWRNRSAVVHPPCVGCGGTIPPTRRSGASFCGNDCYDQYRWHRPVLTVEAIA